MHGRVPKPREYEQVNAEITCKCSKCHVKIEHKNKSMCTSIQKGHAEYLYTFMCTCQWV